MSQKSIKKNYVYNLSYQILLLITPLITTPYLSRVLGADGVGTVSFAESVVSYFTLFATLGIALYGQREISYSQDDKTKRSHVFWETKALQLITSSIALIVYIPFAFFQSNWIMYLIMSLNLINIMTDITWFFQGMEEFGRIVFRNLVIKLINIAFIFIFVKSNTDINIYILGLSLFPVLGNISLWFYLPKFIVRPQLRSIKPTRNLKTIISLFIPTIAIQIYTVLDKTMIGVITASEFENGYYEQAIKISKMVLTIVTALGTVMIPRIGFHFKKGENDIVTSLMYRAYRFVWCLGIPLCFGLIGISSNFVPWFFGEGFDKVVPLLSILSFLVLAIGINNVTGLQYLIPTNRQNTFTLTVLIGSGVNFLLNIALINYFQSVGAAIASVTAETVIALVQLIVVRKELSIKKISVSCLPYLTAGSLMLAALLVIRKHLMPSIINTTLLVVIGGTIYIAFLLIIKDTFLLDNLKSIYCKLTSKLSAKNE